MTLVVSPTDISLVYLYLHKRVRQQYATVEADIRNLGLLSDADTILKHIRPFVDVSPQLHFEIAFYKLSMQPSVFQYGKNMMGEWLRDKRVPPTLKRPQ